MLYWLLFLPGISLPEAAIQAIPFKPLDELSRILLHDLPALSLVWFISRGSLKSDPFAPPKKTEALPAAGAFVLLALISTITGFVSSFFPANELEAFLEPPLSPPSWFVALSSCAVTGYLEEAYFRAYLLTRLSELGIDFPRSALISTTLFALCHLYEGPWGVANAALAGAALSLVYHRVKSVHAPAWAHAAYNAFVYVSYL